MVYVCAVAECKNNRKCKSERGQDLIFHRFPKNPDVAREWLVKCKRKDKVNPKFAAVCSDHFTQIDYERDLENELLGKPPRKKLKSDAVPTLFPHRAKVKNSNREDRLARREQKVIIKGLLRDSVQIENINPETCNETLVENSNTDNYFEIVTPADPSKSGSTDTNAEHNSMTRIKELELIVCNQRNEIIRLHSVIHSMKIRARKQHQRSNDPGTILTAAQRKMLSGKKRVNWSVKDITSALCIRSVSRKAYSSVKKCLKIPLPGLSTLSTWTKRFSCEEGILGDVLEALKEATKDMDQFSLLSVISFDEMSLDAKNVFDPTYLKIVSHSKVQVVMLRGLCRSWKQPVYYGFNSNMTEEILMQIITAVEKTGFKVCALTCDLGVENRSLLKKLKITPESCSWPNPFDSSRNVFVFADVPHCLKNIRNHLLDQGVILQDGTVIDKNILYDILTQGGGELKLCPKLSLNSLELAGAERMRVRPAAQLLSHHMAALAWKCFPKNPSIGNFFELINNGFDVLNSRCPKNSSHLKSGFGYYIDDQLKSLWEFKDLVKSMRFKTNTGKRKSVLLPCQTGFLLSIASLTALYEELKSKFAISYILCSRLNQDCLENFFARIRCFGGPNTHPTASEFRYRLRLVILGSQTKCPAGSNVDEWENSDTYITTKLLESNSITERKQPDFTVGEEVLEGLDKMTTKNQKLNSIELDSLRYLAGYLAWKLRKEGKIIYGTTSNNTRVMSTRGAKSTPWIEILSKGGLVIPNNFILKATITLEKAFRQLYPFYAKSNYCELKLVHHILKLHSDINEGIVRLFVRTRLGIKVKHLNDQRKSKSVANLQKSKQFLKSTMFNLDD